MSTTKTLLPVVLVGGAAYWIWKNDATKKAIQKLSVVGAKVLKVNFSKITSIDLQVQLTIDNPSATPVPLEYYNGTVSNAGQKISDFAFKGDGKNLIIAARKQTPVNFTLNIATETVVTKLINLVTNAGAGSALDSVLQFNGTVYAGGVEIPANFTYDIAPGAAKGVEGIGKFKFLDAARKVLRHSALGPLALAQDLIKKRRQRKKRGGGRTSANEASASSMHTEYATSYGSPQYNSFREQRRQWFAIKRPQYLKWLYAHPRYVKGMQTYPQELWYSTWLKSQAPFVPGQPLVTTTATLIQPTAAAPFGAPAN